MLLIVCIGQSTVLLSLAHAASMAPYSGGPYHWVSEFASADYQQISSYFVGCAYLSNDDDHSRSNRLTFCFHQGSISSDGKPELLALHTL